MEIERKLNKEEVVDTIISTLLLSHREVSVVKVTDDTIQVTIECGPKLEFATAKVWEGTIEQLRSEIRKQLND